MPARPPTLTEAQLAERQREVVRHDEEIAERRVLARQDLPDRPPGIVHVGEGLHERQVEAAESAHDDVRGVALTALAGPAGLFGETIHDQPADVVARARIRRSRVPEPDDDLHRPSEDSTTGPDPGSDGPTGGPPGMVAAGVASGFGRAGSTLEQAPFH